jgi:hypothetical protein
MHHLQFPWRLLTIITVCSAIGLGCFPRIVHNVIRLPVAILVVGVMLHQSIKYTTSIPISFVPVESAEQLVTVEYFAPEGTQEMALPREASRDREGIPQSPTVAGKGSVTNFNRSTGSLSCFVQSQESIRLTLPHFYFPVGWQAEFVGKPIAIGRNDFGLMEFAIPASSEGTLNVTFFNTPGRRIGLGVSAASCLVGLGLLSWIARSGSQNAAPGSKE